MRWVAAGVLTALFLATTADAAGLRDLADGWLTTPGELVRILTPDQAPARDRSWLWRAGLGTGRLFGMPELPLQALDLALGWRTPGATWRLAGSWQVTGGDLFRTDNWTVEAGRRGTWRLGLRWVRERMLLAGNEGPQHAETGLVLGRSWGRLTADLHLPLDAPPAPGDRRIRPVARAAAVAAGVALVVSCERRGADALLLGGELSLGLGPAALLLRFDGASGSLGPGLVVIRDHVLLRTSHVLHPTLGVSHRVQMVVGAGAR